MKITIRTKNLELTGELKAFIEEKIDSLEKFIDIYEVFFEIEKETKHHNKGEVFRSQAKIFFPGRKIMAQSAGDDLLLTVVEIKDKLQQEIKKYKVKKIDLSRRPQRKPKDF